MPDLGPAELLIILLVVVVVFGGSRLAELGGSLGKGIKEFRKAIKEDEAPAADAAVVSAAAGACPACGALNSAAARYCSNCGRALGAN
jgi:sec-independent protein translocase protein TatA